MLFKLTNPNKKINEDGKSVDDYLILGKYVEKNVEPDENDFSIIQDSGFLKTLKTMRANKSVTQIGFGISYQLAKNIIKSKKGSIEFHINSRKSDKQERINDFRNKINKLENFISENEDNTYYLHLYTDYTDKDGEIVDYSIRISNIQVSYKWYKGKVFNFCTCSFTFDCLDKLFKTKEKRFNFKMNNKVDKFSLTIDGFRAICNFQFKPDTILNPVNKIEMYNTSNETFFSIKGIKGFGVSSTNRIFINNETGLSTKNGTITEFEGVSNFVAFSNGKNDVNIKSQIPLIIDFLYKEEYFI